MSQLMTDFLNSTAMVVNQNITGTAVTQTSIDTTTGRLTKVGDFNLGAIGNAPILANVDDINTPVGQYRVTGSPSGVMPATASAFGYMLVMRYNSTNITQIYIPVGDGALAGTLHSRPYNNTTSAWMPWSRIYGQSSLLGTVSQAAGVPTGAALQLGNSANGFFERRASGRAVCTRTDQTTANVSTAYGTSLFRSPDITWTFPTAFFAGTLPAVAFSADNADVIGFRVSALSATAVTFQLVAAVTIAGTTTVRASAIGRWSDMA